MNKRFIFYCRFLSRAFLVAALFVSVCLSPKSSHADETPLISVVSTTGMIADIVRNIGQDVVSVHALMGAGVDPHLYKATHGDISRLSKADIIFYNGLHLEGKMANVFEKLSRRKVCVAVADAINPKALLHPTEFKGLADPHVWFDVALWIEAAKRVEVELIKFRPSASVIVKENAKRYILDLEELDSWVKSQIASIPKQQRVLVTAHDAFGYFGKAYDIEVLGLQGISTATEFGLFDLKKVAETVMKRKIKAVFVESSVPKKFVLALQEGVRARGGSVEIGGELFSDAMGASGTPEGTYIGMVRHNVKTIVEALV